MRRAHRLVIAIALLSAGAATTMARSSGPPASRTGAPAMGGVAAEQLCTACHYTYAPNPANGSIEILDLPEAYSPGATYSVRVRLAYVFNPLPEDPVLWGFQLTAVNPDSGTGAGTFTVTTPLQVVAGAGAFATRRYVEHSANATHAGQSSPVEWTFSWTAPSYYVSRVVFLAAGNAGDGNGSASGDRIFTARDTVSYGGPLDVATPSLSERVTLAAPRPNPSRGRVELSFSLPRAGDAALAVFDAQGRRVRTLRTGPHAAGSHAVTWDGRTDAGLAAPTGVYFAYLRAGDTNPVTRHIVLER